MLKLVRAIKVQQQHEAETNLEALRKTREITVQRFLNHQRLLGKQNIVAPAEGEVAALESSALQVTSPAGGANDTQGLALIPAELGHMGWLNDGNNFSLIAGSHSVLASVLHVIPDFTFGTTQTNGISLKRPDGLTDYVPAIETYNQHNYRNCNSEVVAILMDLTTFADGTPTFNVDHAYGTASRARRSSRKRLRGPTA